MNDQIQTHKKQQEWKSVTVRLKENELAVLNSKLKINGFENFSQFVHAWIKGDYPAHENNEQVERLINRIRDKGIVDPLTGEFNPTFYRNINSEDMLKDLAKRYVYAKYEEILINSVKDVIKILGINIEDLMPKKRLADHYLSISNN
jgi:hypothetical protein